MYFFLNTHLLSKASGALAIACQNFGRLPRCLAEILETISENHHIWKTMSMEVMYIYIYIHYAYIYMYINIDIWCSPNHYHEDSFILVGLPISTPPHQQLSSAHSFLIAKPSLATLLLLIWKKSFTSWQVVGNPIISDWFYIGPGWLFGVCGPSAVWWLVDGYFFFPE